MPTPRDKARDAYIFNLSDQIVQLSNRGVESITSGMIDLYTAQIAVLYLTQDQEKDVIDRQSAKEVANKLSNSLIAIFDSLSSTSGTFRWFWEDSRSRERTITYFMEETSRLYHELEGSINARNN